MSAYCILILNENNALFRISYLLAYAYLKLLKNRHFIMCLIFHIS